MKADRLSLLATVFFAVLTVVIVRLMLQLPSQHLRLVAAALVLATMAALVLIAIHGTAALAITLLRISVLLLPLNGVRGGGATASDLLLVLAIGAGLLHPGLLHNPLSLPRRFGFGLGLFVVAGAMGTFSASGTGVGNFMRLLVTILVAVVGIALWQPAIGEVRVLAYMWLAGNTINVVVAVATMPGLEGRRPSGLSTHPNALGLVSALAVAFAIFIYTTGGVRSRGVAIPAILVSLSGVVVSGSRAAAIASITALLLRTFLAGRWRTAVTGIAAAGVITLLIDRYSSRLPANSALNRLLRPSASVELSNTERLDRLNDSLSTFQAHPWIGAGFAKAGAAHDVVLQVAVASGLLGLTGFVLACSPMVRPIWTKEAGEWRWVALPAVTYLTAALISNNLWDRYVWFCLGLGMLAYIKTYKPSPVSRNISIEPRRPVVESAARGSAK